MIVQQNAAWQVATRAQSIMKTIINAKKTHNGKTVRYKSMNDCSATTWLICILQDIKSALHITRAGNVQKSLILINDSTVVKTYSKT